MFKRLATLLLGLGLVGAGVMLFLAPEQTYAAQLLMRGWPLFLLLAGLVRFAGYLLDRHPRSPVGSLLLLALGGILLAANLRGESSLALLIGRYWFWLLLAFVAGRVCSQYLHRSEDGSRPRAFSPGAIALMLLIAGAGLSANYLARNQRLAGLQLGGRIGQVGNYVFGNPITIDDEAAQSFKLAAQSRIIINSLPGETEIRLGASGASELASAKLSKRLRATSPEQASELAKTIRLQISAQGNNVQLQALSEPGLADFSVALLLEIPANLITDIEVNEAAGAVKLSDLRGAHVLRNCGQVAITRNQGRVVIEAPRGPVELSRIEGDVTLANLRRNAELSEITGRVTLAAQGGQHKLRDVTGAVQVELAHGQLELRDIQAPPSFLPRERLVSLADISDARVSLRQVSGNAYINAANSRIEAESLTGDLKLIADGESVKLTRYNGNLQLTAENSAVSLTDLKGSAEIEADRDVSVQNFAGPLKLKTRHGKINLANNATLNGDLSAENEHGQIRLTLPSDVAFRLDASTTSGRLRARLRRHQA